MELKRIDGRLDAVLNWNYAHENDDVTRLYEKAKTAQWNATTDIAWDHTIDTDLGVLSDDRVPIYGTRFWDDLTATRKRDLSLDYATWFLSQILHGEQGALLAASQIAVSVPWTEAKLYASSQAADEARHVEVFQRYLSKLGDPWPITKSLEDMLATILGDPRWYLKLVGMQLIFESVAMAAFRVMLKSANDALLESIVRNVMADEARHVGFGVRTLHDFITQEIGEAEREELAEFAFETCGIVAKGFAPTVVYEQAGFDADDIVDAMKAAAVRKEFLYDTWAVLVPNLTKAGLVTDRIRRHYEAVGLMAFA